jgi:hypothetical protein
MHSIDMDVPKNRFINQLEVDELKHLIHKLRWMGMDREAETACARLSRLSPASTVFTGPHDTD